MAKKSVDQTNVEEVMVERGNCAGGSDQISQPTPPPSSAAVGSRP